MSTSRRQLENDILTRQGEVLRALKSSGRRPSLLLHCCCAPCATVPLIDLEARFAITALYYNPNIEPAEEAAKREEELRRFLRDYPFRHPPQWMESVWDPDSFHRMAHGLDTEPEGGRRCTGCFRLRLRETARLAAREGFDFMATTLSISPHKDALVLDALGEAAAKEAGVLWLPLNLKRNDGTARSVRLSRQWGLYRQSYCGCLYSKHASMAGRKAEEATKRGPQP